MAQTRTANWRSLVKPAGAVLALLVLILFIALNSGRVEVDLLLGQQSTRLAFALIFSGVLGFVAGYFAPRRK